MRRSDSERGLTPRSDPVRNPFEISCSDPGIEQRLGFEERRTLRAALREAHRREAAAIIVAVADDAWDHERLASDERVSASYLSEQYHALIMDLVTLELPVAVYLRGRVSGFGLALALACDVRFAAPSALLRVGVPGSPETLVAGTPWLLAERLGPALANHASWTGQSVRAEEARRLGLLGGVAPSDCQAREWAAQIAALPGGAASALKRSINKRLRADSADQLEYDAWLAMVSLAGADRQIGASRPGCSEERNPSAPV